MLHGLADSLNLLTNVLNTLRRTVPITVMPLRTLFDLVMSISPGEQVLKEVKNRNSEIQL